MRSTTRTAALTATFMAALIAFGVALLGAAGLSAAAAQTPAINITIVEEVYNTYGGSLETADVATTLGGELVEHDDVVDISNLVGTPGALINFASEPVAGYQQHFTCYRPSTGDKLLAYYDVGLFDPADSALIGDDLESNDEITCVSATMQTPPPDWTAQIMTAVEVNNPNGGSLRASDVELRIDGTVVAPIWGRSPLMDQYVPRSSMRSGGYMVYGGETLVPEPVELVVERVDGYEISIGCESSEPNNHNVDDGALRSIDSDPATFRWIPTGDNTCLVIFADLEPEPEPQPEPVVAMCNGLAVTVDLSNGDQPTNGDDVIRGTSGPDVIDALGGNDTICALQGNDVINAGDGFDRVFAGGGDDYVLGGVGNDKLVGGSGDDNLLGGRGNDRIQGGGGDDLLQGGNGTDRLSGGTGDDVLKGGASADELFGNLGRDRLEGGAGNDMLRGGAWRDIMDGGVGNDDGCTMFDPSGFTEPRINCERGVFDSGGPS